MPLASANPVTYSANQLRRHSIHKAGHSARSPRNGITGGWPVRAKIHIACSSGLVERAHIRRVARKFGIEDLTLANEAKGASPIPILLELPFGIFLAKPQSHIDEVLRQKVADSTRFVLIQLCEHLYVRAKNETRMKMGESVSDRTLHACRIYFESYARVSNVSLNKSPSVESIGI